MVSCASDEGRKLHHCTRKWYIQQYCNPRFIVSISFHSALLLSRERRRPDMNMGLCHFNWLSIQLSVCAAGLLEHERAGEKSLRTKWRDIVCWKVLFIRAPRRWFSFILLRISHISRLLKTKMQHSLWREPEVCFWKASEHRGRVYFFQLQMDLMLESHLISSAHLSTSPATTNGKRSKYFLLQSED